ncbi:MAG: NACHT domain-containing protein [Pseudomonadota bacterium]|nr:NACHT domain-containing protein [Pseudomonadota bacterium]
MSDYRINQTVTGHGNYITATGDINISYRLDASTARDRGVLKDLLDKAERFWIQTILDPLLKSRSWLELDQEVARDQVANPLAQSLDLEQASERPYEPAGGRTDIADIYLEMGRTLLILGEPGAGKTIALLKLARALIARARANADLSEPIPVVLPLGSWNAHDSTLRDWVGTELAEKYFVTEGERLLRDRRLVLLLDGLDEVPDNLQVHCVEAINDFNRTVGSPGMAVCSRLQDYRNLIALSPQSKLRLYGAVTLRPLNEGQIDQYLKGFGPGLEHLRHDLSRNDELRTLARTPLMLNVMAVAYEAPHGHLKASTPEIAGGPQQGWLFDAYIERMLSRKGAQGQLPGRSDMFAWLGWLARQTRHHRQPLFLLERLQPSWLERPLHRWLYLVSTRALAGIPFGLIIALGEVLGKPEQTVLVDWDPSKLALGALFGATAGALMGVVDLVAMRRPSRIAAGGPARHLRLISLASLYGLLWGVGALLLAADAAHEPMWGEGVGWGLLGGLFFATRASPGADRDIRLPELLRWSWAGMWRGLLKGGALGAGLAALTSLIYAPENLARPGQFTLAMLATGALLGTIPGALFGALRGQHLHQRVTPNQGIRTTLLGCVQVFFFTGLMLGLLAGGATAALLDPASGASLGLILGLCTGLAAMLWYGGLALIRHYVLRGVLVAGGYTPLRYVPFLDRACDLIFLRRVGGGYQFVHDLIRRHFARHAAASKESSKQANGGFT